MRSGERSTCYVFLVEVTPHDDKLQPYVMCFHLLFDVTCRYLLLYLRWEGRMDLYLVGLIVVISFLQLLTLIKLSINDICESMQIWRVHKLHA